MNTHRSEAQEATKRDAIARRRTGVAPATAAQRAAVNGADLMPEVMWSARIVAVPTHPKGRTCNAIVVAGGLFPIAHGATLSIYNEGPACHSCQRAALRAEHAAEAAAVAGWDRK